MAISRNLSIYITLAVLNLTTSCGAPTEKPNDPGNLRAFVGGTVIDGTGAAPIANAVIIVRDGRIETIGTVGEEIVPTDADVVDTSGKFVVPGMINAHGHVGGTLGMEGNHYSRENVLRQLGLYGRYGVTTVLSLGGDEEPGVQVRDEQNIPGLDRSRLFVAGTVVTGDTPETALKLVEKNAALGADFIKIRVDDNLGTIDKMTPAVYKAVIDRAHELELPVASHLFYLDDAKGLLEAGTDFVVHSVRDQGVDDELSRLLIENDVCYSPTLAREYVMYAYEEIPSFFDDPFFLTEADPAVLEQLKDSERMESVANSPTAQRYKAALSQAQENLQTLSQAGVTIAMGTDTGPPTRFQGYFEHLELALMAEAGMSPIDILVSATGNAARCIGREDIGTLQNGRWADLVVLDKDPLESVENFRAIQSVWIAGSKLRATEADAN